MSVSTSSILVYQGLRCTKAPRHSDDVVPSVLPLASSATWTSVTSQTSAASQTSITTSIGTSAATESPASNTWLPTPLDTATTTTTTTTTTPQSLLPPFAEPLVASSTASTVLRTPSAFRLSFTEHGPHLHMPASSSTRATSHEPQSSTSASSTHLLVSAAPETTAAPPTSTSLTSASSSTDLFIAESTTTRAVTSNNTSPHGLIDTSDHGSNSAPLRTILGGVLGGVAFVALALAIGYFLFRHKRRNLHGGLASGTSEEHLQDGHGHGRGHPDTSSAASHQGYQSRGSFLSDASSTHSLPSHIAVPITKPEDSYQTNRASSRLSPILPQSNPFTDSAEAKYVSRSRGSVASLAGILRDPFADPAPTYYGVGNATTTLSRQPEMSQRPASVAWNSMYSDLSLGSTLILPGRSSASSSLQTQRLSYPFTVAELESCDPSEPVARLSTRSDPFDLECPPHRHATP